MDDLSSMNDDEENEENGTPDDIMEDVPNEASSIPRPRPASRAAAPRKKIRNAGFSSSGGGAKGRTGCIVKLLVQRVFPDYREPWRKSSQTSSGGTGFIVEKRRIVTNAHVVRRCSHVRARKSSSTVMFSCTVEWISLPLDLAILSVNDESAFFGNVAASPSKDRDEEKQTVECLPLCQALPRLDENVTCVGFPLGGQQISVTRGVVSRVDVGQGGVLRVQIDAAINPGNSGGPVFDEAGRVVGVASSHLRGGSNIGYIIPVSVLTLFLGMCRDGIEASHEERRIARRPQPPTPIEEGNSSSTAKMDATTEPTPKVVPEVALLELEPKMVPGVALLGVRVQTLESKALRKRLGLTDGGLGGGVRISGVTSARKCEIISGKSDNGSEGKEESMQMDDVLMTIDGIEVGQDATVRLSESRPDERIHFLSLITIHRVNHTVDVGILRKGQPMTLRVTLASSRFLCPLYDGFDAYPSYVIAGGCVFVPLSHPWISACSKKQKCGFPAFDSYISRPTCEDEQVIVLHKVLVDEVNVGYHSTRWLVLRTVNGRKPKNLQELVQFIIEAGKGNHTNLEFRLFQIHHEDVEQMICLDMEEYQKAESRIMARHMIAAWCSEDAVPEKWREMQWKAMLPLLDCIRGASE